MTGGRILRAAMLGAVAAVVSLLAPFATGTAEAATVSFRDTPLASWRTNGIGYAALVVGGTAYVGGSFSTVRSPDGATVVGRANLAAFDLATGALVTAFRADTNGPVRALAHDGVRLYVGGSYTTINGVSRGRLAAVDPVTGAVSPTWVANATSHVYDLAVAAGKLYVTGSFSTIKNASRSRVAALSLATSALDPFAPQVDNTVAAVAVSADGSRVYIGGSSYTAVNGTTTKWLTKLDGAGNVVPTTWAGLEGGTKDLRLTADDGRLAVAVTGAGNQGAWYNAATGTRYWSQRCDGDAQAVHVVGDSMFTGFHEACEGDTTIRLTSNATADGARDTAFRPSFDRFWGIWGIGGDSSALVVAGDFANVSGVPAEGFAIFPAAPAPPPPLVHVPATASWRYLDNGSTPPAGWTGGGFDDGAWASGPAQLGYGDGDEATVVASGPDPNHKHITTWFRSTFQVTAVPYDLTLGLLADDGAVVHVNGVEVARDNLPAGAVSSSTLALSNRSGAAESETRSFAIPSSVLQVGTNTIAVEVHQNTPSSTDLSFQASLTSTAR